MCHLACGPKMYTTNNCKQNLPCFSMYTHFQADGFSPPFSLSFNHLRVHCKCKNHCLLVQVTKRIHVPNALTDKHHTNHQTIHSSIHSIVWMCGLIVFCYQSATDVDNSNYTPKHIKYKCHNKSWHIIQQLFCD